MTENEKEFEMSAGLNFDLYLEGKTLDRWEDKDYYQKIYNTMTSWYDWVNKLGPNTDDTDSNTIGEKTMNFIDLMLLQSKENWGRYLHD